MYFPIPCGGGSREEEQGEKEEWEGKRGREREEGGMVRLNADAERPFFWTWQMFARGGFGEHENVKPTWKTEPPFIF